jgi:hypothetical protein
LRAAGESADDVLHTCQLLPGLLERRSEVRTLPRAAPSVPWSSRLLLSHPLFGLSNRGIRPHDEYLARDDLREPKLRRALVGFCRVQRDISIRHHPDDRVMIDDGNTSAIERIEQIPYHTESSIHGPSTAASIVRRGPEIARLELRGNGCRHRGRRGGERQQSVQSDAGAPAEHAIRTV